MISSKLIYLIKNFKKTIQYSFCLSEYKCPTGLGDLNRCFGQRFDSAQLHYMGL